MKLDIGVRLDKFEIVAPLGKGGMGTVYRARDTELGRDVAIKLALEEALEDPDLGARFEREARTLASLNHPNVATLYSFESRHEPPFLVMELVEGVALSELIEGSPLTFDGAVAVFRQVARGLMSAHEVGVVHRDLKPANLMVSTSDRVKIVDFGLASVGLAENDDQDATRARPLTRSGAVLGTPTYMSPEQAKGLSATPASDVWSYGCCLFEALSGDRPFTGTSSAEIIAGILEREPVWTALESRAPRARAVIERCLAKDPERRWPNVVVASEALDALVEGGRIEEDRIEIARLSQEPTMVAPSGVRASWKLWAVAASVTLLALVVGFLVWPGEGSATQEAPTLAVLLFESSSDASADLAAGLTDELTVRLGQLSQLKVIARSSAARFRQEARTPKEVARELGVTYLLEGSVRSEELEERSRVRISPSLVRVDDEVSVWSEIYDRDLKSALEVQTDIASRVAEELQITFTAEEESMLVRLPTDDVDAYQAFLQSRSLLQAELGQRNTQRALELVDEALARDPNFVDAMALKASAHLWRHIVRGDLSGESLELAKSLALESIEIEPTGVAYRTLAGVYQFRGQWDEYESAVSEALRLSPNDAQLRYEHGSWLFRQGRYEESIESQRVGIALNPLNPQYWANQGFCLSMMRRHAEAGEHFDRAVELLPGSFYSAFRVYARFVERGPSQGLVTALGMDAEQLDPLDAMTLGYFQLLAGETDASLSTLLEPLPAIGDYSWFVLPGAILRGWAQEAVGDDVLARNQFELAVVAVEEHLSQGHGDDDYRYLGPLGYALARLGEDDRARGLAERIMELEPVESDAASGTFALREVASIYAALGEVDKAIPILERLLDIPSWVSRKTLASDPRWALIRDSEEFKRLLESVP